MIFMSNEKTGYEALAKEILQIDERPDISIQKAFSSLRQLSSSTVTAVTVHNINDELRNTTKSKH